MMNTEGTDFGKVIRIMREMRGMSRMELSEAANISESHLKKIEAGERKPGIDTWQAIMKILEAEIVIKSNEKKTVKGDCVIKAQEILMDCTESQALYLVKVLEFSAKNISGVSKK